MNIRVKTYYNVDGDAQQEVFEDIFRRKAKNLLNINQIDDIMNIGELSAVLPMEETA